MDDARKMRVLLDTNVWLDYLLLGRSGRDIAEELIRRCSCEDVLLLYAPHSIQDVFFQAGVTYKRMLRADGVEIDDAWGRAINDQAWECARTMNEVATLAGMDQGDLWLAFKYRELHPDLEDDLVIAVAQRAEADYLVTSDCKLIARSPVAALTPRDMLTVLKALG